MILNPDEYRGREQTWIKHKFLEEYMLAWAHKLGSTGRFIKDPKLWFVDCFSGPWRSENENNEDTSIHIGLEALRTATNSWRHLGATLKTGAIFVEKHPSAFQNLKHYLAQYQGQTEIHAFAGEFGKNISRIQQTLKRDSALLFVDPTGWKGAAMNLIAPLAAHKRRDLLVNVMVHHINRWKDDPRAFLRQQLRDFFGMQNSSIPNGLSEEQLIELSETEHR